MSCPIDQHLYSSQAALSLHELVHWTCVNSAKWQGGCLVSAHPSHVNMLKPKRETVSMCVRAHPTLRYLNSLISSRHTNPAMRAPMLSSYDCEAMYALPVCINVAKVRQQNFKCREDHAQPNSNLPSPTIISMLSPNWRCQDRNQTNVIHDINWRKKNKVHTHAAMCSAGRARSRRIWKSPSSTCRHKG